MGVLEGRVGWTEKLSEEWRIGVVMVPEGSFKGDVDLFKSTIGGVIQSFREPWGKRRVEGPKVALEPTKGSGYNNIVKRLGNKRVCSRKTNFGFSRVGHV